jgi:hypothetical protein
VGHFLFLLLKIRTKKAIIKNPQLQGSRIVDKIMIIPIYERRFLQQPSSQLYCTVDMYIVQIGVHVNDGEYHQLDKDSHASYFGGPTIYLFYFVLSSMEQN